MTGNKLHHSLGTTFQSFNWGWQNFDWGWVIWVPCRMGHNDGSERWLRRWSSVPSNMYLCCNFQWLYLATTPQLLHVCSAEMLSRSWPLSSYLHVLNSSEQSSLPSRTPPWSTQEVSLALWWKHQIPAGQTHSSIHGWSSSIPYSFHALHF